MPFISQILLPPQLSPASWGGTLEGPQPPPKMMARLGNYSQVERAQGTPPIQPRTLIAFPALPLCTTAKGEPENEQGEAQRLSIQVPSRTSRAPLPPSRGLLCWRKPAKWGAFNSTLGVIHPLGVEALQAKAKRPSGHLLPAEPLPGGCPPHLAAKLGPLLLASGGAWLCCPRGLQQQLDVCQQGVGPFQVAPESLLHVEVPVANLKEGGS